ncbi:MAG TPA: PHB depolymerase family esterase [Flavobacteriaceae bacterium]|nr:PHB depolymerase family esterase [Flavobacteriaceae bacterium]
MKKFIIGVFLIFSCSPEIVEIPDPVNIIDSSDPVIPVEYGLQEFEIEFQGLVRTFNIFVPDSYDPLDPIPLLFCMHGYGSNNQLIMEYTEFNDIAAEENFIVVYPQGSLLNGITHWNVGGWTSGSFVDDVAFIDFLIDTISENYLINSERIYSTGMSNGGYMSFLLACQLSEKIAAIASVTGSMTPQTFYGCQPQRAISILQMHGTSDGVVPYGGNASWTMGINNVIDYWREHNSCDSSPTTIDIPDIYTFDNSTVQEITYSNGDNNTMVRHYRVDGGGHDWFGAWGNRDIIASEIIWEFFSMYDFNGLID